MVSEICKKLNGSFCIASGNSYLYIYPSGKMKCGETHIDGTAIKMEFSTEQLNSEKEIIAEIASFGELQARTIKNAFQKASTPSKGLISGDMLWLRGLVYVVEHHRVLEGRYPVRIYYFGN